ncbi:hypothetical protein QR692_10400 [Lactococcus petauri]|uniref:hypothetical protein n=1 Tax=Lactococcus petauri TaxID=1940789 RepID=UPI0020786C82|nr:hypothetical protein [Lactococcus petauri]USI65394.1 hypothetical protein LMK05_11285 [Lactococcus petauri]USI67889.1 hypothetical protein LMK04_10520 [Lactococcus petauri]WJE12550.1 hypothetical protein QR692_10400 [Lactococcus petauri]
MKDEELETIRSYIDLIVASTAKQFGAIALDAVYLLATEERNKSVLTFEEVKTRTRANSELIIKWIEEGRLHPVSYPEQSELLFDRTDVDRIVTQYISVDNEKVIKQLINAEKKARRKIDERSGE